MLSNPTRYGLIACRYLVWGWHHGTWLTAPEIAGRYGMNVRALSPALQRLVMAGILRSRRGGTRPGFMIARNPHVVNMLEILRALEGGLHVDCCRRVIPGLQCSCDTDSCRVCSLFGGILGDLRVRLSGVSLEEHAASEMFAMSPGHDRPDRPARLAGCLLQKMTR